jgi:hypothetical protein
MDIGRSWGACCLVFSGDLLPEVLKYGYSEVWRNGDEIFAWDLEAFLSAPTRFSFYHPLASWVLKPSVLVNSFQRCGYL